MPSQPPNPRPLNDRVRSSLLSNAPEVASPPSILGLVRDLPEDALKGVFGEAGATLSNLAKTLDLGHPDLDGLFADLGADAVDFGEELLEIVRLAALAVPDRLFRVLGYAARRTFTKTRARRRLMKALENPTFAQQRARFIDLSAKRAEARDAKKPQVVSLWPLFHRGETHWDRVPGSFDQYVRGERVYDAEIKELRQKATHYRGLGCSELADEADAKLAVVADYEKRLHGFNRITMSTAALILAKMHGFAPVTKNGRTRLYGTVVRDTYDFRAGDNRPDTFVYQPTAFPLPKFLRPFPRVEEIVRATEAYGPIGCRPIFDHYYALVPGVGYPLEKPFLLTTPAGRTTGFSEYEDASNNLSRNLTIHGSVTPAVLGEADGKMYFICLWE